MLNSLINIYFNYLNSFIRCPCHFFSCFWLIFCYIFKYFKKNVWTLKLMFIFKKTQNTSGYHKLVVLIFIIDFLKFLFSLLVLLIKKIKYAIGIVWVKYISYNIIFIWTSTPINHSLYEVLSWKNTKFFLTI